jgi:hypothetical protein
LTPLLATPLTVTTFQIRAIIAPNWGRSLERDYDIFEELPDGAPLWRGHASGLQSLRVKLVEVASTTNNRCFAMHMGTQEVVARLNARSAQRPDGKKVVFQIAYDDTLAMARAALLRNCGYDVATVIGNESAKLILSVPQHFDLFIVGHASPENERKGMVAWLKKYFPNTRVLALNPPKLPVLSGADYNVKLNSPEAWLSVVSTALNTT